MNLPHTMSRSLKASHDQGLRLDHEGIPRMMMGQRLSLQERVKIQRYRNRKFDTRLGKFAFLLAAWFSVGFILWMIARNIWR